MHQSLNAYQGETNFSLRIFFIPYSRPTTPSSSSTFLVYHLPIRANCLLYLFCSQPFTASQNMCVWQLQYARAFNDCVPFAASCSENVVKWRLCRPGKLWPGSDVLCGSGKIPYSASFFYHLCLSFSICKPGIIKTAHWAFHRHAGRISRRLQTFLSFLKER